MEHGYLFGQKFPGITWSQWNDKFKNTLRKFLKGDDGQVGDLGTRISGSTDVFVDELPYSCHPYQSINFITCHDGLCLYDLFAYTNTGQNSWDCKVSGSSPESTLQLRKQQIKNAISLLMLSNGVPMIFMGDEFGHTQNGNDNPYNIDSEQTWLDWTLLEKNKDLYEFTKRMIQFRKDHPVISSYTFWRDEISWFGVADKSPDWGSPSKCMAYSLGKTIYVMISSYWEPVTFKFMESGIWKRFIDTSLNDPFENDVTSYNGNSSYEVNGRTVAVFLKSN
jgi:glycogen operon protein